MTTASPSGEMESPLAVAKDLWREMIGEPTGEVASCNRIPIRQRDCDIVPRQYVIDWRNMFYLSHFNPQMPNHLLALLMPYDLYERHAVVSWLLQETINDGQENNRVLDVGGRARLLERFVSYRVLSINTDGSGNLLGNGCVLPFADSSFIAVVSIDTLEHLPKESRLAFLRECLRVAQRYVIIAAPFGSEGHRECEKRLDSLYRSAHGEPHIYLNEHIRYGLPDIAEIDQLARNLEGASSRRFFAGDYVWQGKQFERAILGYRKQGMGARVWNLYNYVTTLAVFHPIRLREQPDDITNRFYLFIEKKYAGAYQR